MLILREDYNLSNNFEPYVNKKSALEGPKIEANDIDLINESLNTRNYAKNILSRHIF